MQALVAQGALIDGFGFGTRMNTLGDASRLDCVYKLIEYASRPRCTRTLSRATWPGCKQVFREVGEDGLIQGDALALQPPLFLGTGLLHPVVRGGARLAPVPSLDEIQALVAARRAMLPALLRALTAAEPYTRLRGPTTCASWSSR